MIEEDSIAVLEVHLDRRFWRFVALVYKRAEGNSKDALVAKSVATQERLVDGYGRLRSFRDGCCDQKDVARHVARNIYAGDSSFLCIGVHHDATLRIPLAAKTLRKVRCLMAAG